MLPLLLNEVCRRNLALEDVVRLTSENPAKVFSIRRKGRIAEGYDADLVIVDLKSEKKVDDDRLFTKCGWSPFSGRVLRGWPTVTLVRGAVVYDNGVVEKNAGKEVSYEKK
jgi:dihydroorotase